MNESFPQNIKLGVLEAFRDELVSCFNSCVQDKQLFIGSSQCTPTVTPFLPLLLNKIFDLSKMSLATILQNPGAADHGPETCHTAAKKEVGEKYPVLLQKIHVATQNWRSNTSQIIQRWDTDKDDIAKEFFNGSELGTIVSLGSSQGDEHEGGQQSLLIELSDGRKIAYKPRCLAIEQNFYRFAKELGFSELYQPKYLLRQDYGWMEYIPQQECATNTQVADYYFQAGLLLSLLYALEAEDIHHENIIARGAQPVVVDLETLFHHRDDSTVTATGAAPWLNLGNHTVLKTHFIPQCRLLESKKELSAIFAVFDDKVPTRNSLPRFQQQPIAVNDYIAQFIAGFKTGYLRLIAAKAGLLKHDGPLKLFAGCRARYICRPTKTYARLIQASSHPKYLQCVDTQAALFEKLKLDVAGRQFLARLLEAEQSQLLRAEIPIFTHHVDQTAIYRAGKLIDKAYFALSGLDLCRQKIANMNESDLAGQVQLIKHAFELSKPKPTVYKPKINIQPDMDFTVLCETSAYAIGRFLLNEGMPHQNGTIWPLFKFDGVDRTYLEPTNSSLYDGYLGIYLFLAHLQQRFTELCQRELIINQAQAQLHQAINNFSDHDGCGITGLGGMLYSLSQLAKLWPQQEWIKQYGQRALQLIEPFSADDDNAGIIDGSAGAILSLLSYYHHTGVQHTLDVACCFGDSLLRNFNRNHQPGWQTYGDEVLSGFAHGNAGIGFALMQLAQAANNEKFSQCAAAALEFESSQYKAEIGNWPDKRLAADIEKKNWAMTAWCHGAVGIGMSRLALANDGDLPEFISRDIDRSLTHLLAQPIIKSEGLCHGNFGNFELLMMAKQRGLLTDEQEQQRLSLIVEQIKFINKEGLTHHNPELFTPFSLMNGWAGVGYQLLRFAQPENVPNILLFNA